MSKVFEDQALVESSSELCRKERKGKEGQQARRRFPRLSQARVRHTSNARKGKGFQTVRLICSPIFRKLLTVSSDVGVGQGEHTQEYQNIFLSFLLSLNNYSKELSSLQERLKSTSSFDHLSISPGSRVPSLILGLRADNYP